MSLILKHEKKRFKQSADSEHTGEALEDKSSLKKMLEKHAAKTKVTDEVTETANKKKTSLPQNIKDKLGKGFKKI